jgi:hypothetical protein
MLWRHQRSISSDPLRLPAPRRCHVGSQHGCSDSAVAARESDGQGRRSLGDPLFDTSTSQGRLLVTMLAAIAEATLKAVRSVD